jgi:PRTRC genetic system ThiF family protein
MNQTLNIQKRYTIQTPEPERCTIILVGCGGTGSFLALHLARLAYHVRDQYGYEIPLFFIDPDVVEQKNLGRQNFAPSEVGRNKAQTLAWRYNMAFGLGIQPRAATFEDALNVGWTYRDWGIIVGAVDNAAARRSIAAKLESIRHHTGWWLDCGNHEHAGQVLLGSSPDVTEPQISPLGYCSHLPIPTVQHPELLEDPEPVVEENDESCADLALRDAQSLMINQAVASYASQYVYRMLIAQDLDIYATYVDLVSGAARSLPITGECKTLQLEEDADGA